MNMQKQIEQVWRTTSVVEAKSILNDMIDNFQVKGTGKFAQYQLRFRMDVDRASSLKQLQQIATNLLWKSNQKAGSYK
jgi:hypothetical protein